MMYILIDRATNTAYYNADRKTYLYTEKQMQDIMADLEDENSVLIVELVDVKLSTMKFPSGIVCEVIK